MWNRREWARVGTGMVLAAALPAVGGRRALAASEPEPASPPPGAPRIVIGVDNKSAFCYLPLTVAERLGYFALEGLDVQVRDFTDAQQALQAFLGGSIQVLSGPYSNLIQLQLRGLSYQSIVLQGRAPQIGLGISLRTLANYRGLGDLRGRRMAIMAAGSGSHRVARLLLSRAGVGEGQVQMVPMTQPAAAVAAFRAGQVDAICYTDPVITLLEHDGLLRLVADTRSVRGNAQVFGGPMPAGCLSASESFVSREPEQCQALTHAMVHALKWLQTAGPADLISVVPERYFEGAQGDRAIYLAAFSRAREAWTPDGVMPEGGPATAVRMLAQFGDSAQLKKVVLERTYTNDFALKAKHRFRI
jgi:NitT/TauT family transport system substrate-binding protein